MCYCEHDRSEPKKNQKEVFLKNGKAERRDYD